MELNEYQEKAMTTCLPSCENDTYMLLNLVGEVGEFASKIAKAIRKEEALLASDGDFFLENQTRQDLMLEAGDILWQLSGLCKNNGWTLEEVAQANLFKLASRKERGVIAGDGDHR